METHVTHKLVVDPFSMCIDPDKIRSEQEQKEQALEFAIKDLADRRKKLTKAEEKLKPLADAVRAAKKYLEAVCYHPEDQVKRESYYFEGSYNDCAYTEHWNECKICGAKSERTHKSHSWYG